jgi:formyl-CoA transferase
MVKEVVSAHHGLQHLVGQPVQLDRTPGTIARAAPKRGEHNEEILKEIGINSEELLRLKAKGVY